jgi:hypothetical protein
VELAPVREVSSLVFGIGMQEMVIVGLLFLVIFGPSKPPTWPETSTGS